MMINAFDFKGAKAMLPRAVAAARATAAVAGNFCVLFTAHDAYMRDYRLVVPQDCVASLRESDDRVALAHMARVTKAEVRASREIDPGRL